MRKGDKILLRGDCFGDEKKIKIIIEIPNKIYLEENVQQHQLYFIERTLKNELDNIENYRRSGTDYFGTLVHLKIIK